MFEGLGEVSGKKWAEKVPNVPILMLAGCEDPVAQPGSSPIKSQTGRP